MLVAGRPWTGNIAVVDRSLMTPVFRAAGTATTGFSGDPIPLPADSSALDFDIIQVNTHNAGLPAVSLPGWTVAMTPFTVGSIRSTILYRNMDGSESNPIVTTTPTDNFFAQSFAYTGVRDIPDPIDAANIGLGTGSPQSYLQVTTSGPKRLLVHHMLIANAFTTVTPGAGWTERAASLGTLGLTSMIVVHTIEQLLAGTTAGSFTTNTGINVYKLILALRPA